MARPALFVLLILLGIYLKAQEDNCSHLSSNWTSEKQAITQIENRTFKTNESISMSDSSRISSIQYCSCDDKFGFLLIKSENNTFLHKDVPASVWIALKNAKSNTGYYKYYIKNKYLFETTILQNQKL